MYHPSRGGVRGGRDQFNWDDVKVDKHRENYLGHSVKAPVGRWQRGKDLHWYAKSGAGADEAARAEIARVQAEEDQAMREALGLAPARDNKSQSNRLDKHELQELLKRGKTAEELSESYVAAERVQGVGFGPVTTNKKVSGYEMGEQLSGIEPPPAVQSAPTQRREEVKLSKEEKRAAKEQRKQEKRAAKVSRKEERKRRKEQRSEEKPKEERQRRTSASDDEKRSPRKREEAPREGRPRRTSASDADEEQSPRKRPRRRHDSDSD